MRDFWFLTLYVMRHGECEHNVEGWAASHNDSPLIERGRQQARANGRPLKETLGDLAALDLRDHGDSARGRGSACNRLRADRRSMESNLGDHTRVRHAKIRRYTAYVADPWNCIRPGGERIAMVHDPIGRLLRNLTRGSVVVSHMIPVIMIRACYLGLTPEQTMSYEHPNGGMLRLSAGTEGYFGE